jgi:hypothetical protein
MKQRLQGMVMGFLAAVLLSGLTVWAATGTQNLAVTFRDIKLFIDGTQITPKDANGNVVEPFLYNGTTYLPVRAVGEAFGKTVDWDGNSSSVFVGAKPAVLPTPAPTPQPVGSTAFNRVTPEVKTFEGQILTDREVDTFTFSLPYAARVVQNFKHAFIDSTNYFWTVTFSERNLGNLYTFDVRGNESDYTSYAQYLPKGEYTITVKEGNYNRSTEPYNLTVSYERNGGAFETEPNDRGSLASPISLNTPLIGNISKHKNVDFYKLTMTSTSYVTVEFLTPEARNGAWQVEVFDANDNAIAKGFFNTVNTNHTLDRISLPPGTYYIKVYIPNGSDFRYDYTLTLRTE